MVIDVFRLLGVMMFDSVGYDHEVYSIRLQIGMAIWMAPEYLPFF